MLHFHGDDSPAGLNTHEELEKFLTTPFPRPAALNAKEIEQLSAEDRRAHDRKRRIFLSGGITLKTDYLTQTRTLVKSAFSQNSGRNSGHQGVMLSGDSTLGKTTIAKSVMQGVHAEYARFMPDYASRGKLPVVFVEVPVASTPKLLMKNFADFLGLHVRTAESARDIQSRVVQTLKQASTQLIVIDELHNLLGSREGNSQTVDALKSLHNDLPATFLYAGIDIARNGLLKGARGQQLSGRFQILSLERLNTNRSEDQTAWTTLINGFEEQLPLANHPVGNLAKLDTYLWERTGGSIGSLGRLLTGAAIDAIDADNPRAEKITRALLDAQYLDHAAESTRSQRKKQTSIRHKTANQIPEKKLAS